MSTKINWEKVYKALEVDFGTFDDDPNYWTIPVCNGVTSNKVVKALSDHGVETVSFTRDVDSDVTTNDRHPSKDGSYQVKFLKLIEADPKLKNKSADTLGKDGVEGITLLERLLLELGYFLTTGKHLDLENVTLCSGSRGSDGNVPHVHWAAPAVGRLNICWCQPSYYSPRLRGRAVVS